MQDDHPHHLVRAPELSGSAPGTDDASLATRDLQRDQAVGLASGGRSRAASACRAQRQAGRPRRAQLDRGDPLWLSSPRRPRPSTTATGWARSEAGPSGEVLVGIVDADPESFRSVDPGWTPTLPARAGPFGLADILAPADR